MCPEHSDEDRVEPITEKEDRGREAGHMMKQMKKKTEHLMKQKSEILNHSMATRKLLFFYVETH